MSWRLYWGTELKFTFEVIHIVFKIKIELYPGNLHISRPVARDAIAHSGPCDWRRREMCANVIEIGLRCQYQPGRWSQAAPRSGQSRTFWCCPSPTCRWGGSFTGQPKWRDTSPSCLCHIAQWDACSCPIVAGSRPGQFRLGRHLCQHSKRHWRNFFTRDQQSTSKSIHKRPSGSRHCPGSTPGRRWCQSRHLSGKFIWNTIFLNLKINRFLKNRIKRTHCIIAPLKETCPSSSSSWPASNRRNCNA